MNKRKIKKKLSKGWVLEKGVWRRRTFEEFMEFMYPPKLISSLVYRTSPFIAVLPKEKTRVGRDGRLELKDNSIRTKVTNKGITWNNKKVLKKY